MKTPKHIIITNHFLKADPKLHAYIEKIEIDLGAEREKVDYFTKLCDHIISQQLSVKAADTIFARFLALFPKKIPTPEKIMAMSHEKLRSVGLSNAKANYIRNLAEHVQSKELNLQALDTLPEDEVIRQLTAVKGIGQWTAEMFLMFTLDREDIFSHGDLGLKKGIMKIYGYKETPSIKTVERLTKKWRPYRTYACRVLWRVLDLG